MKILVTGANGFIGRNIKSILPQEAEVIGIGHSDNPLPMANYKTFVCSHTFLISMAETAVFSILLT